MDPACPERNDAVRFLPGMALPDFFLTFSRRHRLTQREVLRSERRGHAQIHIWKLRSNPSVVTLLCNGNDVKRRLRY